MILAYWCVGVLCGGWHRFSLGSVRLCGRNRPSGCAFKHVDSGQQSQAVFTLGVAALKALLRDRACTTYCCSRSVCMTRVALSSRR